MGESNNAIAIVFEPAAMPVDAANAVGYAPPRGDIVKPLIRIEPVHVSAAVQHLLTQYSHWTIAEAERNLALRGYCWDGMPVEWCEEERALIAAMEEAMPLYKYPICTTCHGMCGLLPARCACNPSPPPPTPTQPDQ